VVIFLVVVFTTVYEFRMLGHAEALRKSIESGQVSADDAAVAYRALVQKSLFSWPLLPARNSLRDRYTADADRVIADYREASESTPVYRKDWQRAQSALTSAAVIAPDDKTIRGKARLVSGFLHLNAGAVREARANFEEAKALLKHSPDPDLG